MDSTKLRSGQPDLKSSAEDSAAAEIIITSPLPARPTYAFALGEMGVNMPWNMVSGFLLFYYTNVAMLPVAAVGTLLLLPRILDAFMDPLMGILVDRTRTRFGKARPYLMAVPIPFAVLFAMTFSVPDWSVGAKLIYAWITFGALGIVFAAIYIPCHAMLPLMTNDPRDKLRLGSYRAVAASIGSIIVYGATLPIVSMFGADKQTGFTVAAAAVAVFMSVTVFGVAAFCPERLGKIRSVERKLGRDVKIMLSNPIWRTTALFTFTMFLRFGVVLGTTAYYATEILKTPWAAGAMLSSMSLSILIGGLVARPLLARLGKRKGNVGALVIAIVLNASLYFLQDNIYLFGLVYFLANITLGIHSTTTFILVADSIDHQQRLSGVRNEGMLSSCVSLSTKIGLAIGGALVAYALAIAHYNPKDVSDTARTTITFLFFGAPIVFALLQTLVISRLREPGSDYA